MKVTIDTNVFISGIFFTGPPYQILQAWRKNIIKIVISPAILEEYQRVSEGLIEKFPNIDLIPIFNMILSRSKMVSIKKLSHQICDDPDDDKFIACALVSNTKLIVSGDKHLLKISGFEGIRVVKPKVFVDKYLPNRIR